MLFPLPELITKTWSQIATATVNNDLGSAAKIASDEGKGDRVGRLICVYTEDFSDMEDVKRVISKLVEMGLVDKAKSIYYKCGMLFVAFFGGGMVLEWCANDSFMRVDAYTYLGINSGNEYGLKASLYASKDVLAATKK